MMLGKSWMNTLMDFMEQCYEWYLNDALYLPTLQIILLINIVICISVPVFKKLNILIKI